MADRWVARDGGQLAAAPTMAAANRIKRDPVARLYCIISSSLTTPDNDNMNASRSVMVWRKQEMQIISCDGCPVTVRPAAVDWPVHRSGGCNDRAGGLPLIPTTTEHVVEAVSRAVGVAEQPCYC